MGVSHQGSLYMSAGRGFYGVGFSNEVWKTANGTLWKKVDQKSFPKRAYHNMVSLGECMYVFGGQTFTRFYNDVWRSCDQGYTWEEIQPQAPWKARAGAGAIVLNDTIYVAGGCYNNEDRKRSFLNDVWRSRDGVAWEKVTDSAEWSPRSGARLVALRQQLFIVAGEIGFTPETQLGDVWVSDNNGQHWSLATDKPGFSPRSGHGVVEANGALLLVGGWPKLYDVWKSKDGVTWEKVCESAWNCHKKQCGRFDFWPVVHNHELATFGGAYSYSTFGKLWSESWGIPLKNIE